MTNSAVKAIGVPLMQSVLAKYPNLKLSPAESLSGAPLQQHMASEVDLALAYSPPSGKDLVAEPLLEEQMYCVGTPVVIGASKGPITFDEFAQMPIVLRRQGMSSRSLIDDPSLLRRLEHNAILHLNSITGTTGALLGGLVRRDRETSCALTTAAGTSRTGEIQVHPGHQARAT